MTRILALLALASGLATGIGASGAAAQTRPSGAPLGVDAPRPLVVMNLAAHPDDEDGLTLAYYRGHKDAIAYSVIYTRGEGGQNEAGPDLYERLGAIRTQETEAAGRTLGTQVFFLNRYDFGYSKHAREAFAEWSVPRRSFWESRTQPLDADAGRAALVRDLVTLYRTLKPDIVFTNHDSVTVGPGRQHGQHQAVGITAIEAFDRAADPTYNPAELGENGVSLWQPRRLFLRVGGFTGTPEAYDVAVPVSETCAETTYRPEEECARRAVAAAGLHVSQGFDLFAPRFYRETTHFQLLRSAAGEPPLPEGATDLFAGLEYSDTRRGMTWPGFVDAGRVWTVEGLSAPEAAVPGETFTVRAANPGGTPEVEITGPAVLAADPVVTPDSLVIPVRVLNGATITEPARYLQYDRQESNPPILLLLTGEDGAVYNAHIPTGIAPPVTADLPASPIRLAPGANTVEVSVDVHDPATESVEVLLEIHWEGSESMSMSFPFATADTTVASGAHRFPLAFEMDDDVPAGSYEVILKATPETTSAPGSAYAGAYVETRPAAVLPDVSVARGLRVGFVRSYDGTMGDALTTMGADVVELDSLALARGDFDGLHTVVIDIRAYLEREDLRAHNDRLLAWVETGGHLVVGYQKLFEWNTGRTHPLQPDETNPAFAPYPLELGRERVTMEDVPVTLTMPEHPLFTAPHAITAEDWDGWVQERGLYFPTDEADARYARPLAMADRGESPLTTGILLADVGEGTYLYSPLVWYRQLAALNPGAWRLFANLVSLPLTDEG